MKKVFALFTFFLFISIVNKAQDTIIKINGDTVIAKIYEINPTQIKFKKFNFQNGPIYIENKSEIKYVIYSNGVKEKFAVQKIKSDSSKIVSENDYYQKANSTSQRDTIEQHGPGFKYKGVRIGEREMHERLMSTNDREIFDLVQSAKSAKRAGYIGFVAIPFAIISGGALFIGALSEDIQFMEVGAIFAGVAITFPVASAIFQNIHHKKNKEAIRLYNQRY